MIHGIEFVKDRGTKEPWFAVGDKLRRECLKNGLYFTLRRNGSVLRFVPPFSTTNAQLDRSVEILRDAIKAL